MRLVQAVEQMEEEIAKLKQERDEAVALAEVMRGNAKDLLTKMNQSIPIAVIESAERKLRHSIHITGPDALREIQARTLREAADLTPRNAWEAAALKHKGVSGFLQCRADRIIKGE